MNKQILTLISLLFSLATLTAQGYIKFDGIDGEVTESTHNGWSDIISFSVGLNNSVSATGLAGGRGAGKTSFGDLMITKNIDKAAPKLMEALVKGKPFSKVELHLTHKTGNGKPTVYYRYELKNVIITSYQIAGDASGGNTPLTEQISMTYGEMNVFYTAMDGTGKPKEEIPFKWDIKGNKAGN